MRAIHEYASYIRELVPLLFVEDIDRSIAFYRNNLGFEMVAMWESDGKTAWCRLQRGCSALMLQQGTEEDGPAEGRGRGISFYFICDNAEAIHTDFCSRGLHLNFVVFLIKLYSVLFGGLILAALLYRKDSLGRSSALFRILR